MRLTKTLIISRKRIVKKDFLKSYYFGFKRIFNAKSTEENLGKKESFGSTFSLLSSRTAGLVDDFEVTDVNPSGFQVTLQSCQVGGGHARGSGQDPRKL